MARLEVGDLYAKRGEFTLGPIDLDLEPGGVYGLIGPNGAGKSTLLRCIMGLARRQRGSVKIDGRAVQQTSGGWRQLVGYVGDTTPLIEGWSGRRNLAAIAPFYDAWSNERVAAMASRLELDLDQTARAYSTGQRAKLAIIRALAHGATLMLLDEPAAGLDPLARDVLLELLHEQLQNELCTMLYATHHVSEIDRLAGDLVFIDAGRIVANERLENLEQRWGRITFRASATIADVPGRVSIRNEGKDYEVITRDQAGTLEFLRGSGAASIQTSRLSIEQICVQLLRNHAEA